METFMEKVVDSFSKDPQTYLDTLREAVQYYLDQISRAINGNPELDLPFILFALESAYAGARAAADPTVVEAADSIRGLLGTIAFDSRNLKK